MSKPGKKWPGSKAASGTVQKLINEIPPHDHYVAAFAGADQIGQQKLAARLSTYIDPQVEALKELQAALWPAEHEVDLIRGDAFAWLPAFFNLDRWPQPPTPRPPAEPLASLTLSIFDGIGGPLPPDLAAFVYIDPPYPLHARSGKRIYGDHELTDEQHDQLVDIARRLPCPTMISCYDCEPYKTGLADWRRLEYFTQTHGGRKLEVAWMNYPRPPRLHDSRFVGQNKRQRERIRRRVRNWAAGLERMTPHERQAVEDAIARQQ